MKANSYIFILYRVWIDGNEFRRFLLKSGNQFSGWVRITNLPWSKLGGSSVGGGGYDSKKKCTKGKKLKFFEKPALYKLISSQKEWIIRSSLRLSDIFLTSKKGVCMYFKKGEQLL